MTLNYTTVLQPGQNTYNSKFRTSSANIVEDCQKFFFISYQLAI